MNKKQKKTPKPAEPQIVFQNTELLILNKPSGWIVNAAKTTKNQPVIQSWLAKLDFPLSGDTKFRGGIVHRIDKETSGILVVAKTKKAFTDLQSQFKARKVQKSYLALVHGKVEPEEGTINVPVGRLPWNRERFGVLPGGRKSETSYKTISFHKKNNQEFTFLEAYPKTGRTHQIRVHMQYLGHPIVSDPFYSGRKRSREDKAWCPRLFLHASKISFTSPGKNKNVSFQAPLPKDLKTALSSLE